MEKGLPILYRFNNGLVEAYSGSTGVLDSGRKNKKYGGPSFDPRDQSRVLILSFI